MVLAWSLAVPTAVLLARFFKVTPGQRWPQELDNPTWWHGHRIANYLAVLLTALALALIARGAGLAGPARTLHAALGWSVAALALVQLLSAHLRGSKGGPTAPRRHPDGRVRDLRGDHYDMTPRRILFEAVHKGAGYLVLLLALASTATGLRQADAPRWMVLLIGLWWSVLAVAFIIWQRRGRCLDTYQAIWGPGHEHPGHAVGPVGPGIRRAAPPAHPRT
ncbi:MAG: cytochrome b [Gammaproteobacteria bacterium]|nr:cytochrome B [Burkholderiales bacterium]MCC7488703.1 cytochrome b [Gammaproteobacteria bacterium]